jgi:hypothetical protein
MHSKISRGEGIGKGVKVDLIPNRRAWERSRYISFDASEPIGAAFNIPRALELLDEGMLDGRLMTTIAGTLRICSQQPAHTRICGGPSIEPANASSLPPSNAQSFATFACEHPSFG